jgi:bud site selection protein 20
MAKKGRSQKQTKSHSHKGTSHFHKVYKTKRKTKDHDQIHEDLKAENAFKLLNQPVDIDLAGSGQYYCIHCA